MAPTSHEHAAGMELFYTDTPPLGGKLRVDPRDFVVEEVGNEPRPVPDGKQLALRVRLENWEHNHFIRDVSRTLRCGRNNIGFSGTKDKRAVTAQWFTVRTEFSEDDAVARIDAMPRVEVLAHHRTDKKLRLGMHTGNRFTVTVRNIERDEAEVRDILDATMGALDATGGAPNFFGIQRFGAVRPITHIVGRHLIHGEVEEAILTYITAVGASEHPNTTAAREQVAKTRDWKEALEVLPHGLKFERAIAQRLMEDPDDAVNAIRVLPANLLTLLVFAYQSYLFNRILSARIRDGLPIHRAVEGDIVLPMLDGVTQERATPIPVDAANVDKINRQLARGRGGVTAPLYGTETKLAGGAPGEIERRILDAEGVTPDLFSNERIPELSSGGVRRVLMVPLGGLDHSVAPDTHHPGRASATFSFTLTKGAYATTVLREVIKSDDTLSY